MENTRKEYTVDYFIKKFKNIPKKSWCVDKYEDDNGRKCALGHCNACAGEKPTEEAWALQMLFAKHLKTFVSNVNDDIYPFYTQEHPKDRILAALHDIKEKMNAKIDT